MADFKEILKYLRQREKLTQRELAEKLNLSFSTIGMYETGKRMPTLEIEEMIADYFNVSLDVLRGRSEPNAFQLTDDEKKIIIEYRKAPKHDRDMIRRILSYYEGLNNEN